MNDFSRIDAQCAEGSFAYMTPEEHTEYQAWLDARTHEAEMETEDTSMPADAIDHGPEGDPFHDAAAYSEDSYLDASYEDRTEPNFFGDA